MSKNKCLILLQLLIICTFTNLHLWGFSGVDVCDEVQKRLITEGFTTNNTNLISPAAGNFTYNISIDFSANDDSNILDEYRKNMVLVFNQKDFLSNADEIISILNGLADSTRNYTVTVLFSSEGSETLEKGNSITGTDVFTEYLSDSDNTFAVIIRFSDIETPLLLVGNSNEVSPLWLAEALSSSFIKNNASFIIPAGIFLPFYRFNLLKDDYIADTFFKEEIPTATLVFPQKASFKNILLSFTGNYDYKKTSEWDRHYFMLHLSKYTLTLDENFILRCCIVAAFLTLFILCWFSFLAGKNIHEYKQDILSLWYLIPVSIVITFLALWLGHYTAFFVVKIFHVSPIIQLYARIQVSFFAISILYFFIIMQNQKRDSYVYKFYMILSALLNIFIFSAIDISFFFLFAIEYILLLISRPAKRAGSLIITGLILFIPFIPFGISVWSYIDIKKLQSLITGDFYKNLLLALALQPFQLIWLAILSRLIYRRTQTKTHHGIHTITTVIVLSFIFFLCFSGISVLFSKYRIFPSLEDLSEDAVLLPAESNHINVSIASNNAFGNIYRTVTIAADRPVERYEITVSGKTKQPVYEAVVPYIEDTRTNSAIIRLPDFPPKKSYIIYTTTSEEGETISIKAYYPTDVAGTFELESIEKSTDPSLDNAKGRKE